MKTRTEAFPRHEQQIVDARSADNEMLLERATTAGRVGAWQWDIAENRASWTRSLHALLDIDAIGFDGTPDSLTALIHPEDRAAFRRGLDEALRSGETYDAEARAQRCDGESQWLRICMEVIREGERNVRVIGTAVDVDTNKRTDAALREWSEQRFMKIFPTAVPSSSRSRHSIPADCSM